MAGGMAGKTQSVVNTTTPLDGDSIAAFLADGSGNFAESASIGGVRRFYVATASEFAEDSAHVSGDIGTQVLAVRNDAGTTLVSADGDYSPLSLDANGSLRVNASISGAYAEDSAHVSGDMGIQMLVVRNDAGGTMVSADGDYSPLQVDASGRLRVVADLTTAFDFVYAEDAAHASGDLGAFILGVRQDTTAATAGTTGDYSALQTWSNGDLKVVDNANLANLQQVLTVGTTAAAVPTLANRKTLFIQNQSVSPLANVFVGSSTVTATGATTGFKLSPGAFVTVEAGPANPIFVIASAAATPVGIWELS